MTIKTKKKATSVAKKTPATIKKAQVKKTVNDKIIVGWKTVDANMCSWYNPDYKFTVGKEHTTHIDFSYGKDPCGTGLHFGKTEEEAIDQAADDEYIMLEVQTYERDILGQDGKKIRTKKLMVNKILEKKTVCGEEWEAALEEIKEVSKKLLKPNKAATIQKLTALSNAYCKAYGYSNAKMHLIENQYELNYALEQTDDTFDNSSGSDRTEEEIGELDFSVPNSDVIDNWSMEERAINIAQGYLADHQTDASEKDLAQSKPLFELLSLGCLPIGMTIDGKHFVIFHPTEDISKTKSVY